MKSFFKGFEKRAARSKYKVPRELERTVSRSPSKLDEASIATDSTRFNFFRG